MALDAPKDQSYNLFISVESIDRGDAGLRFNDLLDGDNRLQQVFLDKAYKYHYPSTSLAKCCCFRTQKDLTKSSTTLAVLGIGLISLGIYFIVHNPDNTTGVLLTTAGVASLIISSASVAFHYLHYHHFLRNNQTELIPKKVIKKLFDHLSEDHYRLLNCEQFSKIFYCFQNFQKNDLNLLTETQSYLKTKIPLIKRFAWNALSHENKFNDLVDEVQRHPVLLEAIHLNLPKNLRNDQEIQLRLIQLDRHEISLPPPPSPQVVPIEKKSRNQDVILESPIPQPLILSTLQYYITNIERIKPHNRNEIVLIDWEKVTSRLVSEDVSILNRMIGIFVKKMMVAEDPAVLYSNIQAFLKTFGLSELKRDIDSLLRMQFRMQLIDYADGITWNRLIRLLPIVLMGNDDPLSVDFSTQMTRVFSRPSNVMMMWDEAVSKKLVHLKKGIAVFCYENPGFADETWLAVPRELRELIIAQ